MSKLTKAGELDNLAGILKDPYAPITGGVINAPTIDQSYWADKTVFTSGRGVDVSLPEDGNVHIGDDFTMTTKEFKICMKMLRKMAMKEMPEDFI